MHELQFGQTIRSDQIEHVALLLHSTTRNTFSDTCIAQRHATFTHAWAPGHADTFPTKASPNHMARRHHRRNFATPCAVCHALVTVKPRQASFTPPIMRLTSDTRRIYTCILPVPQWHGDTQKHFPPRPRKSAWHSDIADILRPRPVP